VPSGWRYADAAGKGCVVRWTKLTLAFCLLLTPTLTCAKPGVLIEEQVECPAFPYPSEILLDKIRSLGDPDTDEWMVRLARHAMKLEVVRGR